MPDVPLYEDDGTVYLDKTNNTLKDSRGNIVRYLDPMEQYFYEQNYYPYEYGGGGGGGGGTTSTDPGATDDLYIFNETEPGGDREPEYPVSPVRPTAPKKPSNTLLLAAVAALLLDF